MMKSLSCACALGIVLLLASIAPTGTIAQQAPPAKPGLSVPAAAKQVPKATLGAPTAATQPPTQIPIEQVLYLIRATLLTLSDANRSGNYSVLRDLAAPEFQAKNTAADLAQAFADMRRRKVDLFAAALAVPQLTAAPAIHAGGKLHLSGLFPTRPLQIKFDLMFEASAGQWKLLGLAIAMPEAPPLEAQLQHQQHAPKPEPKPAATAAAEPAKRPPSNNPSPR